MARVSGDRDRNPPNRPPAPAESLPDREMMRDDTLDLNVSRAFADPDGDSLTWAASAAPDVVTVTAAGSRVTLTAVGAGTATIAVLAHLTELRQALAAAYTASGRTPPRWTDAAPTGGATPIRAAHLTELRAAVVALE